MNRAVHLGARARRAGVAVVLVGGLVGAGACGGGGSVVDDSAPPTDLGAVADLTGKPEVEIAVGDNTFEPAAFNVSPGTRVTFRNKGVQPHDVTPAKQGLFSGGQLRPGTTITVDAPTAARPYRFHCSLHGTATGGQRGAMVVA